MSTQAIEALRTIATDYDHDNDAHKYGTTCRKCLAAVALVSLHSPKEQHQLSEEEIERLASSWADSECGIGAERKFKDEEQRDWWYTELGRTIRIIKHLRDSGLLTGPKEQQDTALREAAQAVINRWDSPQWERDKHGNTGNLIADLRKALSPPIQEQ